MKSLESFLEEMSHLSREEFLAQVPHPVLISSRNSLREARSIEFDVTRAGDGNLSSQDPLYVYIWMYQGWVFPLAGEKEGDWEMINIGRLEDNDIILPLPIISKKHCLLKTSTEKAYVVECGSTNGTRVEGHLLMSKGEKISLDDGDRITLGDRLEFEFLHPSSLWEALEDFKLITALQD